MTRTRCVATMLSGGHAPNALPQRAEANVNCRIFPGVKPEAIRGELQRLAGDDVKVELVDNVIIYSDASPLRADIVDALTAAVATRFKDAPLLPIMEVGASDSAFTRAVGIPSYGIGTLWAYAGEKPNLHGLDERVSVEAFHDQVPIWTELIRRLAGR